MLSRSRSRRSLSRRPFLESLCKRELLAADFCLGMPPSAEADLQAMSVDATTVYGPMPMPVVDQGHTEVEEGTRIDSEGRTYSFLPPAVPDEFGRLTDNSGLGGGDGSSGSSGLPPAFTVPIYSSKPSATKKIYLDFDGQMVSGTTWNNQNYTGSYNTGSVINAPAFSIDSDLANLNAAELTLISEVWARVSEDFAPFQVDVTTQDPGDDAFSEGGQAIRALISTDTDATSNQQWFPNAGGVAYLNSWYWTNSSPVWVFANKLGNGTKNIAEATSHEVGHAFGLNHDGRTSPSEGYYRGHGNGQTGWAPIMGVGYSRPLVQWSQGEYANANNTENDVQKISQAVPFEIDDHGNDFATATEVTLSESNTFTTSGLISTRTDVDIFRVTVSAGRLTLNAAPFELSSGKSNLDIQVQVKDSNGDELATANPFDKLDVSLTVPLPAGTYSFGIDGVGKPAISDDEGYSDYGSLGTYTVAGAFALNHVPVVTADVDSVNGLEGGTVVNSGTWSDPDFGDTVVLSASIGTVVEGANGTWSWSLDVADQMDATEVLITATDSLGGESTIPFSVTAINVAPVLTVSSATLEGNVLSVFTNTGTWGDVPVDTVTLSASLGSIDRLNDGTWVWTYIPSSALSAQQVTIHAADEDGGSTEVSFVLDAMVAVINEHFFYKNSEYESVGGIPAALDPSKTLLRAGTTPQLTSSENLINYSRGINGAVLDIAGLTATSLSSTDFLFRVAPSDASGVVNPSTWSLAPEPIAIVVTPGSEATSARVRLEWADNAIENTWLQILILANANTGLSQRQAFYLGHALADVDQVGPTFRVSTNDLVIVRAGVGNNIVEVNDQRDINKDRRISTLDVSLLRSRVSNAVLLREILVPAAGSEEEGEGNRGGLLAIPEQGTKIGPEGTTNPAGRITGRIQPRMGNLPMDLPAIPTVLAGAEMAFFQRGSLPLASVEGEESTLLGWDLVRLDAYFAILGNRLA